jgi:hypothetical protein
MAQGQAEEAPRDKAPLGGRRVTAAAGVAILLSVLMNLPIAANLTTSVSGPARDPGFTDSLLAGWNIAWGGHALRHDPGHLFQANAHFPLPDGLAFHDTLLGYSATAGLIGNSPKAAIIRYNLLHLFAYALAFFGMWLLATELGVNPLGAGVAGALFAYAPWKMDQAFHLHILSAGGIPLAIFLLLRGYRRGKAHLVLLGWLAATWQMSLGFSLGLQLGYLLLGGMMFALVTPFRRHLLAAGPRVLAATTLGLLVFILWTGAQARPFLRVARDHPEAKRSVAEVTFFSPPPIGLVTASLHSYLWGERTADRRRQLPWAIEQSLFPGVGILALAAFGIRSRAFTRPLRAFLLAGTGIAVVLSLGFKGPLPQLYRFMYAHAPGWDGIRTPGRLLNLATMGLALLAAAGVHMLIAHRPSRGTLVAARLFAITLAMLALAEGAARIDHTRVPEPPAGFAEIREPSIHLPTDPFHDMQYMFWSIGDFPSLANGHAVFIPRELTALREAMKGFPDRTSTSYLAQLGVRAVVFHPEFARGTQWENVPTASIEGLPLTREVLGSLLVYRIT